MSCVKLDSGLLNTTRTALEDIKSQISTAQQNLNESASAKEVSLTASYLKEYETYSVQVKKYDDYGNVVYDDDGNPELVWVRRRRLSKDHTENAKAYNKAIANIGTACASINNDVVGKISKVIAALNAIEAAVDKFESQDNFSLGEVANTDFIYLTELEAIKQSNKLAWKKQVDTNVNTILRNEMEDVLVYGSSLNEKLNNNEITLDEYIASLSGFANREHASGTMGVVESILITTMLGNPTFKQIEEEENEERQTGDVWKNWITELAASEISTQTDTEISNQFEILWENMFSALIEEDKEATTVAGNFASIAATAAITLVGGEANGVLTGKVNKNDNDDEDEDDEPVSDQKNIAEIVDSVIFPDDVGAALLPGYVAGQVAADVIEKGADKVLEQKVENLEEKMDEVVETVASSKEENKGTTTQSSGGGNPNKNNHTSGGGKKGDVPKGSSTQSAASTSVNTAAQGVNKVVQEQAVNVEETVQAAAKAEEKIEPKQEQKVEEAVTPQETPAQRNEREPDHGHDHEHDHHKEEKIEEIKEITVSHNSDKVLAAEPPKEEPVKVDTPKTEESSETIAEGNKTVAGAIAGAATIGATTSVVTGNSGSGGILSNIPTTGTSGTVSNIDVPTTVTPNQGTPVSTGNNSMINNSVPTMDNQVADNSSRPTNTTTTTTHTTASSTNPTNETNTAKNTSSATATRTPQTAINKVDDDTPTNKSANKHSTKPETAENKEEGKVETKDSGTLGSAQVAVKELEEQYKKEVRIATAVSAGSVLAAAVIKFADLINIIIFLLLLAAIILLYTTFRVKKKKDLDKKIAEVEAQAMIEKDAKKEGISLEEVADASEKVVSSEDLVAEENTEEPKEEVAKEEVTKEFSDSSDVSSETKVEEKVEEQQVQEVAEAKGNEEVELPVSKKESEYVIINQPPVKKEEEK